MTVGLLLAAAAIGSSFLALVFTGGDSAFATEPRWIYWPWMAALLLTVVAEVALALAGGRLAVVASSAAVLAYAGTLVLWWARAS